MQAWEEFLKLQEKQLGGETVKKWLHPLKIVHFDACNLYLEAENSFQAVWFEEHMRPKVLEGFYNNNNHHIKVHISVNDPSAFHEEETKQSPPAPQKAALTSDYLDPWASLDNFIASEKNKVPFQLLCQLAGYDPSTQAIGPKTVEMGTFNPIYLYGSSGSGKTHLVMAVANLLLKQNYKVMFVRSETFTEHVVSAIRSGNMQNFRAAYRHVDVLIIDDVHLLAKRAATQEEFFHTFNTLHTQGKQIILTANALPQVLSSIEPRLISRFEWGITLCLEKLPPLELKSLLKRKSEFLKFPIDEPVAEFLIKNFPSGTKALSRALENLVLQSHLDKRQIRKPTIFSDTRLAESYLIPLLEEERRTALTPNKILRVVAEYYGIRMEDILGKSQTHEYTLPRQISMYLCREKLKMPYMKIGDFFDRDHSTVMSSVKQIQKRVEDQDKEIGGVAAEMVRRLDN